MTLILDLTPEEEARLQQEAARNGVDVKQYARQRLGLTKTKPSAPDAEGQALIDLMQQWIAEDVTDDPEEIARREADWEELEKNLEANRLTLPVPEV